MANPEHLALLQQGVKAWNEWRQVNLGIEPDLISADLGGATLCGADLRRATLSDAALVGANFRGAAFFLANIRKVGMLEASTGVVVCKSGP